jgi:hypothetical protein
MIWSPAFDRRSAASLTAGAVAACFNCFSIIHAYPGSNHLARIVRPRQSPKTGRQQTDRPEIERSTGLAGTARKPVFFRVFHGRKLICPAFSRPRAWSLRWMTYGSRHKISADITACEPVFKLMYSNSAI